MLYSARENAPTLFTEGDERRATVSDGVKLLERPDNALPAPTDLLTMT